MRRKTAAAPEQLDPGPSHPGVAWKRAHEVVAQSRCAGGARGGGAVRGGNPGREAAARATSSPWMLAGLLYLGSGIGLGLYRLIRRPARVRLERHDLLPLGGACSSADVVGPGAADVRTGRDAGIRRVSAPQRGRSRDRPAGVVRLQGEFRPPDRARHGRDRRGRGRAVVAGPGRLRGHLADRWRSSARAWRGASTTTSPARWRCTTRRGSRRSKASSPDR